MQIEIDEEDEDYGLDQDDRFEVWPENWESVQLFLACATKWDMVGVGMGGVFYTGLSDQRIGLVMRLHKARDERRAFDDLRVMEAEAKNVLNTKVKESLAP